MFLSRGQWSLRDDRAVSAVLLHGWCGRHIHPVSWLYLLRQGCSRVAEPLEQLSKAAQLSQWKPSDASLFIFMTAITMRSRSQQDEISAIYLTAGGKEPSRLVFVSHHVVLRIVTRLE